MRGESPFLIDKGLRMKVKALKSFYVQRLKSVVTAGQEFETSKSHGDELITMGMAVFVDDKSAVNPDEEAPKPAKGKKA